MPQLFPTFPPLVKPPHWEYYLALEEDLLKCSRFVEFTEDNSGVFSIEFARLLLVTGSEIDMIAKEFCKLLEPTSKCEDMNDYQTIITSNYPRFDSFDLYIPRFSLSVSPWKEWGNGQKLSWWQAYNAIKHDRASQFEKASLKNTVSAVSGLFSLLLYYYREIPRSNLTLGPPPRMFASRRFAGTDAHTQIWAYDLPDKYLRGQEPNKTLGANEQSADKKPD